MRVHFLLIAVLALALAMPADARHCTTWSTDDDVEFDTNPDGHPGVPRFYVDNDRPQVGCCFSLWIYQESNGIDGLQRGDEVRDDTCHGMIPSDTIIF